MDRTRWLYFGAIMLVAFVASAAVGAWVGRQRGAEPISAVASPTPVVTASPTTAATTNPPPATPTVATSAGPSPVPPTAAPSPSLDPPTAGQFALDIAAKITAGDSQYMFERLHPAVIDRYGEAACHAYVDSIAGHVKQWTVDDVTGPAAWTYTTDALDTLIAAAWTVSVNEPAAEISAHDLHVAAVDGRWRWFTDCGEPR